jgi:hypothetical protein
MTKWTDFVKAYAAEHNILYSSALSLAKGEYRSEKEQSGGSLLSRISDAYNLADDPRGTPTVRKIMSQYGDKKIVAIKICKEPVFSMAKTLLNKLTRGKLAEQMKKNHYDELYHLFAVLELEDGKSLLTEKNERVVMSKEIRPISSKGACINVSGKFPTVADLMNNTMRFMGKDFFIYRGSTLNCQNYISRLLDANKLLTKELNDFIFQDVKESLESSPFAIKLMNRITDTAKGVSILMEGKGKKAKKKSKM